MAMIHRTPSSSRFKNQNLRWLVPATTLCVLSLGGIWELFLGGAHRQHLLPIFLALFLSGLVVLTSEFLHSHKALVEARLSHDTLRKALLAGNSVAWDLDVKTGEDRWFGDLKTMFGISDDTFTSQRGDFYRRVHPEDVRRVSEAVAQAEKSHSPYTCEFRIVREDGNVRWVSAGGEFQYSRKGDAVRMLGIAVDITDRVCTEEALRESEERFRRVVEHIGDGLLVENVEGHAVFANDRFLQLFGFRREQLFSLRPEDFVAPEYLAEIRDRHTRRMRGESVSTHFEHEGIRADGKRLWLEVDVVPIVDQEGKITGTQSAIRDISARKKAETELRESEERFRLVANTAPVMIWMVGADNQCTYVNKRWLEFTGRELDAELGNGWLERIHSDDLEAFLEACKDGFAHRATVEVQYRLLRHDRQYRWILDFGVPRFNHDGSFAGYIGSCIDITERKRAEEAMATIGRRLIEAHEEERTWIGRELHDDINQRLAFLSVELDRLIKDNLPKVEARGTIHRVQQRMTELTRDIQNLSHRFHSSKLEYLGLARAASSFCKELSQQSNVEVIFRHEGVPTVVPPEISLSLFRVLQESLQNAVKHSGVKCFTVDLHGTADSIELTVLDRGAGFDPPEALTGRGLGLISMRERLEMVNGEFSIRSKPGSGTTIRARVPLPSPEPQALAG
jgi:PAS domain S-box-containing protein